MQIFFPHFSLHFLVSHLFRTAFMTPDLWLSLGWRLWLVGRLTARSPLFPSPAQGIILELLFQCSRIRFSGKPAGERWPPYIRPGHPRHRVRVPPQHLGPQPTNPCRYERDPDLRVSMARHGKQVKPRCVNGETPQPSPHTQRQWTRFPQAR